VNLSGGATKSLITFYVSRGIRNIKAPAMKDMERRLGRCFSLSISNFDILFSKLYLLSFILARGLGFKVKGKVEKQDCNEQ